MPFSLGVDIASIRFQMKSICILSLFLWAYLSNAQTVVPNNVTHQVIGSGRMDIPNNAIIEGSHGYGGLQPDYLVDLQESQFQNFLINAREIGIAHSDFWDKVHNVIRLINSETFEYVNYKNPYYLRLLKKARGEHRPVKLSEYFSCRAGVCREFGLFTHFALKAAGIPNDFVYAQIQRASNYDNYNIIEDHAFVVVMFDGVEWVIDPYYWGFNGFKLSDLMRPEGVTVDSEIAPIAIPGPGFRRIIKINSYPKVWVPKTDKTRRCKKLLSFNTVVKSATSVYRVLSTQTAQTAQTQTA